MPDVAAKIDIYAGWYGLQKGRPEEGLKSIRAGLDVMRELGGFEDFPIYISMEAEALLALGRAEEAYKRLTEGDEIEQALQFKYWAAELDETAGPRRDQIGAGRRVPHQASKRRWISPLCKARACSNCAALPHRSKRVAAP